MRHPATKGRADSNQAAIKEAIEALGYPVMVLSHAGGGCEDLLVPLRRYNPDFARYDCWWELVECKVPTSKRGTVRYTKQQKEWRAKTAGWPRITATSAQDAVDKIRGMTG